MWITAVLLLLCLHIVTAIFTQSNGYVPTVVQIFEDCQDDGLFYRDESSFMTCSHGIGHIQKCPPGTRNSLTSIERVRSPYPYSAFCNVNLVDDTRQNEVYTGPVADNQYSMFQSNLPSFGFHASPSASHQPSSFLLSHDIDRGGFGTAQLTPLEHRHSLTDDHSQEQPSHFRIIQPDTEQGRLVYKSPPTFSMSDPNFGNHAAPQYIDYSSHRYPYVRKRRSTNIKHSADGDTLLSLLAGSGQVLKASHFLQDQQVVAGRQRSKRYLPGLIFYERK